MAEYTYTQLASTDPLYNAFLGRQKTNWNTMKTRYGDSDDSNDLWLRSGTDGNYTYERIDPTKLQEAGSGKWMTLNGTTLDPNSLFWRNKLTPTASGTAFRLNSNTPPPAPSNDNAYSYNEWKNGSFDGLQALSGIYGDIDTRDEFNIINGLGSNGQAALNYINDNYIDANGNKKALFTNGQFTGTDDELKAAAALLNQYLTNDNAGKEFATQLRRGQATLPMLDRYKAYGEFNGEGDDKIYLNQALNSRDKMYRGAQFYRRYAGDKTWGNLANQFAVNNLFRKYYTVDADHVMDRLNRDAGLGNGRKLIDIYNDIINKGNLNDEQAYAIFRDMTRRRFKMDNDFWNRHATYLSGIRNKVVGADEVVFEKEGGQIFRMLFV